MIGPLIFGFLAWLLFVGLVMTETELHELRNRFTRLAMAANHPELGYGWVAPLPDERSMNIVTIGAGGGGGSGRIKPPATSIPPTGAKRE